LDALALDAEMAAALVVHSEVAAVGQEVGAAIFLGLLRKN